MNFFTLIFNTQQSVALFGTSADPPTIAIKDSRRIIQDYSCTLLIK